MLYFPVDYSFFAKLGNFFGNPAKFLPHPRPPEYSGLEGEGV